MSSLHAQLILQTHRLEKNHVDSPRLSAEILLAHALGVDRQEILRRLILQPELLLENTIIISFAKLIDRRAVGEPIAYILGKKEFYGRDFFVSSATLIPRPETELFIDTVLKKLDTLPHPLYFADLGTGSGCIALSLGLEIPESHGIALDRSITALHIMKKNAHALSCYNVLPIHGDFYTLPFAEKSFSLLVSNPPYVSENEYQKIQHEVRHFEPKKALVPSARHNCTWTKNIHNAGLSDLFFIAAQAKKYLQPEGLLLMEMGSTHAEPLYHQLKNSGWSEPLIIKDLAGLDRLIMARA